MHDVDTGTAGGLGIAAGGVEVPAPGRLGQQDRAGDHEHDRDRRGDRDALLDRERAAVAAGEVGQQDRHRGQRAAARQDQADRLVGQPGRLGAHRSEHRVTHVARHDDDHEDPALGDAEVAVGELEPELVVGGADRLAAQRELKHALPGQEQGQRGHEARDADLGDQPAVEDTDRRADADGGDQGGDEVLGQVAEHEHQTDSHGDGAGVGLEPDGEQDRADHADDQRPVEEPGQAVVEVALEHRHRGERRAQAAGGACGEVDLAQQEHEDQAQGDHRDVGALAGQVAEVQSGQEPVADLAEDDDKDDEAEDRGQRAWVTGPELADPAAEGVADRLLLDVEGEAAVRLFRERVSVDVGLGSAGRHGAPPQMLSPARVCVSPSSPLRPEVISSTIWVVVVSLVCTSAATRPR